MAEGLEMYGEEKEINDLEDQLGLVRDGDAEATNMLIEKLEEVPQFQLDRILEFSNSNIDEKNADNNKLARLRNAAMEVAAKREAR